MHLNGVSCVAASCHVAGDRIHGYFDFTTPVTGTLSSPLTLTDFEHSPGEWRGYGDGSMDSISCAIDGSCAAVGVFDDSLRVTFLNTDETWSTPVQVLAEDGNRTADISCTDGSFCMLVTAAGYSPTPVSRESRVLIFDGTNWGTSLVSPATSFNAASCWAPGFCTVIAGDGTVLTSMLGGIEVAGH